MNNFLNSNNVGLYGLLETKIKPNKVNKSVANVFSDWSVTTNTAYHPRGRIWVVWKPHLFDICFLDYDAQYIHMKVYDKHTNGIFFFTVIYAFNGISDRESLWNNLRKIKPSSSIPWLLGGDFNCVLQGEERLGGTFNMAEADPFQKCIDDCEVMDIHTSGSFYTWNNKQPPETRVYNRLDRVFVNQGWTVQYPDLFANFLPEGLFDHSPCVIGRTDRGQHRNRPFKYFNMWSLSPEFLSCVSSVWNQSMEGTKMYRITQTLKMLKYELKKINRTCYSDIENQALLAETKLFHAQQELSKHPRDKHIMAQEYEAHQAFRHLQLAKTEFLKQKAKAYWMNEGDTNSSYFHGAFLEYYQGLLGSSAPTLNVKQSIVQKGNICTEEQRQVLLSPVTHDEIKDIIFNIPNEKAPGPDGYSSKFFKDSWEIVGGEISNAILDFFDSGSLLKQVNTTLITLIPKVERPETVLQYRPIACCNIIYKCISKILCKRLSFILPDLISQNQGGFIQGRSIMENILICQDLIRLYERQASSPRCLFKMDLQKAYNSVEWGFLEQMLKALQFPTQFIGWVMQCVTTASYSLSLNGNMFGFFKG
ncbi:uncharacterized protein LOC141617247 [Silene latifolia]|uniref:uncharacterized protein LOC141617247 n=1 Tax=Silene latifolia TaxID=37657 RepID=UPI003D77D2BF